MNRFKQGVTYIEGDTRSPYEDRRHNAVSGTPESRWYKLRYLDSTDTEIGLFSDIMRVIAEIY
jgi:hypothetical protein